MSGDIPAPPAIFVGREAELARITRAADDLRLVVIYGIAGVGKTALALRGAYELAERKRAQLRYCACRDGESAVTAAAALGAARMDPLRGLIDAARETPIVAVLDDLHRADPALPDALAHLAALGAPLWIFATSREALAISPVVVDHLVVRLGGLDRREAEALWMRLEGIYGPPTQKAAIIGAVHTPLALKQAFAGPAAARAADPLGLSGLTTAEARALTQLCAFRRAIPTSALAAEDLTLARLEGRFLVERTTGGLAVHDLVRESVTSSALAPGIGEHARALEYWVAQPISDTATLEILHHAVAAGDDERALAILRAEAGRIARVPPGIAVMARDQIDAIDRLAARGVQLPAPVRTHRARLRARQGEPARACDELRALQDEDPLATLDYGAIAVALGRTREARPVLARAVADDRLSQPARLLALASLCAAYLHDGEIAGGRRVLARARPLIAQTGALGEGLAGWITAVLAYEGRRYDEAAAAVTRARAAFSKAAVPVGLPLLSSVERAVAAARGDPPGDDEGDADALFDETPFLRHTARLLRAEELWRRGQLGAARMLAAVVAKAAARLGYPVIAQGAARLLEGRPGRLPACRPREGFDAAEARLDAADRAVVAGRLDAAGRVAREVEERANAAGWLHLLCRARLVRAECALRRGSLEEAAGVAAAARTGAAAQGYPEALADCDLLDAALERLAGATASRRDGPLAARLGLDRPATLLLRDSAGRRILLAPAQLRDWDLSRYAAAVDLTARRVRLRRRSIDLGHRGALCDLVRVLAREPGALVPTADLVRTVWNLDYHPLRHHSRVTMAVSRLRRLVGASAIEGGPEGYRLVAPEPWAVIEQRPDGVAQRGRARLPAHTDV